MLTLSNVSLSSYFVSYFVSLSSFKPNSFDFLINYRGSFYNGMTSLFINKCLFSISVLPTSALRRCLEFLSLTNAVRSELISVAAINSSDQKQLRRGKGPSFQDPVHH